MFTERFNALLSEVCHTTTGEFSKITKYDRSYVSHLRNGDRTPKPDRSSAERLSRAVYLCAAEKDALDALCERVGTTRDAGDNAICAAVGAWLFDAHGAGKKRRESNYTAGERRRRSSFGSRLALVMELADISGLRLARSLNVDASLIAKYRSGLRVPRVNHPLIRDIGTALAARIYALDRIAALSQLIGVPQAELSDESVGAKRLEAWLRDYSAVDTSLIEGFLEGMDAFSPDTQLPLLSPDEAVDEQTLLDDAGSYDGIRGLQRAVLRFLGSAVKNKQKELLLYSDQSIDWMVGDREYAVRWMSLMSAYVRGGGRIRIIHNVDRGLEEMFEAIRNWLPLYLSGGIESWYCQRHGGERFSHTLFLAPDSACVFGTYAAGKEQRARYRYAAEKEELSYYRAFFDDLLAECRPLFTLSLDGSTPKLPAVMNDSCVHVVVRSLSLGTMPESLLRRMLARAALPQKTEQKILSAWASRHELIRQTLEDGEIHECIALPDEKALAEGEVAVDTVYAALRYTPEEFGEHIRSAVALSERKPNYRLYPLREPPFKCIKLVISGHMALIVSISGRPITFTTTYPTMCRAFVDFAGRLEEQYDVDRLSLKEELKQKYYGGLPDGELPTDDNPARRDRNEN
ncbi:MAG: hypothetical protein IJT18_00680 [Oscillospiraceae bacterium]|nr:hypothetical protein [Oscillospiraceae bacterium]